MGRRGAVKPTPAGKSLCHGGALLFRAENFHFYLSLAIVTQHFHSPNKLYILEKQIMNSSLLDPLISQLHLSPAISELITILIAVTVVSVVAALANLIVRRTLLSAVTFWIQNNRYRWDDPLAANRLLSKVCWFVPVIIFTLAIDTFLDPTSAAYVLIKRIANGCFVIVSVVSLSALLSSINDIHRILRKNKGSSLRGYTDAGKILSYVVGAIFLISIFTGKSPWGILSILGGLTAVTLLVFKDSILGFVASVLLTSTDMIRLGDWVEIPQYGADGDVIDMSIHSIRVQNWDKTITTIPPYALVAGSFKNWRGMSESGGRRIKRAISIDMNSIRFCDEAMLEKFSHVSLISDYVAQKQHEIETYNREHGGEGVMPVNGRRQTNIGIFRAYIIAYLKSNPKIHTRMTFLVRQLAPNERGLPLEIYAFSTDQAWASYEGLQADIFDHLLAALPEFGLRVFQNPSGYDFRSLHS